MRSHKATVGTRGEDIAARYLLKNGYKIRENNFRSGYHEIDLICEKNDMIIFVEVRTRNSSAHGYPEETVSKSKESSILTCAENYIFQKNWKGNIRFDIIAILLYPSVEIMHIKDAFY